MIIKVNKEKYDLNKLNLIYFSKYKIQILLNIKNI